MNENSKKIFCDEKTLNRSHPGTRAITYFLVDLKTIGKFQAPS